VKLDKKSTKDRLIKQKYASNINFNHLDTLKGSSIGTDDD